MLIGNRVQKTVNVILLTDALVCGEKVSPFDLKMLRVFVCFGSDLLVTLRNTLTVLEKGPDGILNDCPD